MLHTSSMSSIFYTDKNQTNKQKPNKPNKHLASISGHYFYLKKYTPALYKIHPPHVLISAKRATLSHTAAQMPARPGTWKQSM